jgi:hypothetical protein
MPLFPTAVASAVKQIGADPADSSEVRLEKTILVSGSLAVIAAASLWGIIY